MNVQDNTAATRSAYQPPRPAAERNYPMNCWWVAALTDEVTEAEMHALKDITEIGFDEDQRMIEAVQRVQSRDPRNTALLEKSVKSDGPGVEARRLVQKWMARETG